MPVSFDGQVPLIFFLENAISITAFFLGKTVEILKKYHLCFSLFSGPLELEQMT